MLTNFNVRKMYSTTEKMDCSAYSVEIIIIHLKKRISETNFFWKKIYHCFKDYSNNG